jgi:daunorubicin resistance ABC transporter ATP-binding subunit
MRAAASRSDQQTAYSSAIRAVSLQKRYGEVLAVRGVSVEVQSGEIFGFLGRNGSGKTTTVRMLTTLTRPTAGAAYVGGVDVLADPAGVRALVGVTMQEAALDPNMTGREHLALVARLWGFSKERARDRSEALLELFGLRADGSRRISTYSLGMQRRLDIATSLLAEPRVLFLDEPTTGLDPQSRRALWDEIRRLRDEGATVFLTTQYMEDADQLADRLAIIDGGSIIAEGSPPALKREHGKKQIAVAAPTSAKQIRDRLGPRTVYSNNGRLIVELDGDADVDAVITVLRTELGRLEGLTVTDADLEDVFVRLTGTAINVGATAEPDRVVAS